MKNALTIFRFIAFGIVAILIINGCRSPEAKINESQKRILKGVDKKSLLNIVADMSENMSKNHNSVSAITKALKVYSATYKINFTGNNKSFNTGADYLNVYLLKNDQDTTVLFFCRFSPPASLYSQVTFNDLKGKFGDWKKVPSIARPMEAPYIISSFNYKAAPGVSVIVESKKLPESTANSIEHIKLSPAVL